MSKLLIISDIHGFYTAWEKAKSLLDTKDVIAIAGDLFDTKYGSLKNSDFQPEKIKEEFINLPNEKYYVYGNCDLEEFYPFQEHSFGFNYNGKKIFLRHGHIKSHDISDYDLIVEGHTHCKKLSTMSGKIFLNPGSIAVPRDDVASYAILQSNMVSLFDIYDNKLEESIQF